jgi:ribosomal-protein-alanine N-acetyltransferase
MPLDQPIAIERMAGDEDLDAVVSLEAASFTNPWTREMLLRELERSEVTRVYVLRLPGRRVAAFCACWVVYDELHINTVAVDAALRRNGLATRLMRHVIQDAARDGARRATLEVRRSNTAALALYQRLGFDVTAVRPRYYSQPEEDALILWRDDLGAHP